MLEFIDFIIKATIYSAVLAFLILLPNLVLNVLMGLNESRFKCMQCGNCCRLKIIHLTKEDVVRLEKAGYADFTEMKGGEVTFRRVNGRCLFNKDDNCSVYEHRARVCREFPFFTIYGIPYCRIMSYCPAQDELRKNLKWIP
ncbi:MAG: YkgJ family cysteine cluster protein [Candidatus Altiarchaeota archaeon]|nr:YkgJ family cysteine cluster protein [Candidatus Altiarchaeota archaeon]